MNMNHFCGVFERNLSQQTDEQLTPKVVVSGQAQYYCARTRSDASRAPFQCCAAQVHTVSDKVQFEPSFPCLRLQET